MSYTISKYHGSYNIVTRSTAVRYIVCHYTGSGTSATGSARANCIYFSGGNRNASAHYFIDDGSIYEYADPEAYATWHCGDGHGAYGITNANSIGIEVCMNGNNPYTAAEIDRLTWLVQKLMKQFNVPADRVVRHYDASRKACPFYYTPSGAGGNAAWNTLRAQITGGAVSGNVSGGGSSSSGSSSSSDSAHTGTGFGGVYVCQVDTLNVRSAPSTSASVVAQYKKGQTVTLDDWYQISGGWVWGRYTGASSGLKRYVAVGKPTGGVAANDYLIKKGASAGSSSNSGKSVDTVAREVIQGKWGSGNTRKQRLEAAGYNYNTVQNRVNELLGVKTSSSSTSSKKSVTQVAQDVINGKYGNGSTRKQKIEAAGYNYNEVQAEVNRLLGAGSSTSSKKSIDTIAREVIAGKWGNGTTRKQKLEAAGYNYNEVQKRVNQLL